EHGVSIKSMNQTVDETSSEDHKTALLAFITHRAKESELAKTLEATKTLAVVDEVLSVMRVEGKSSWHHRPPLHLPTEPPSALSPILRSRPPRRVLVRAVTAPEQPCNPIMS